MEIVEYQEKDRKEWDEFVNENPLGRFVHLTGFKDLVEKTFHFPAHYWLARKEGKIAALLPAFGHSGFLGKKRLVSQPFSEYGGLLISLSLSTEEKADLVEVFFEKIKSFLKEKGFEALEIHNNLDLPEALIKQHLKELHLYQYAVLKLAPIDQLWQKSLNYQVKKAIKRAESGPLKIHRGLTGEILKENFYPLYFKSMKRFGSPPQPLEYYLRAGEVLKDNIEFIWAEVKGVPIAGLLGWKCGQRVQITETVSNPKFWAERPNDLLHWEFIKLAQREGFKYFDFGPARYEGQIKYKKKWGCDFSDYSYYYLPAKEGFVVPKPLDDRKGMGAALSFFWQKIIPLGLTPRLGKYIRKHLGR